MLEVTPTRLSTQRFLHGMGARQVDALARTASEVMFPARHRVFADGDHADKFWLVQSGHVALDMFVPGAGLTVIGRVGIGELVGWSWLVPPYRWAFGAVCLTEVRAFQFDAPAVRDLCAADPAFRDEISRRLFRVAAARLQDTRTRLAGGPCGVSPYAAA
jgi:CRP/FNR family cyclic AMP-dependent transcriptional regulator